MLKTFAAFLASFAFVAFSFNMPHICYSQVKENSTSNVIKPDEPKSQSGSLADQLRGISKAKSSNKAFIYSALIPGSGELYSEAKRGYVFLGAEMAFWAAFFLKRNDAQKFEDQYVAYVKDHLKFDEKFGGGSFEKWDMEDFEHATLYDNWRNVYTEEEGRPKASVGAFYWEDDDFKDRSDERPESEKRGEALRLRQKSNQTVKTARTFVGFAIFNHLISAIDSRIAAKLYNKKLQRLSASLNASLKTIPESGEVREEIKLTLVAW